MVQSTFPAQATLYSTTRQSLLKKPLECQNLHSQHDTMPCLHHFGRFDSNLLICDDEIGAGEFLVVALCSLVLGQSNHATFSHRLQHGYDIHLFLLAEEGVPGPIRMRTLWYGGSVPAAPQAPWTPTPQRPSCAVTSPRCPTAAGMPRQSTAAAWCGGHLNSEQAKAAAAGNACSGSFFLCSFYVIVTHVGQFSQLSYTFWKTVFR